MRLTVEDWEEAALEALAEHGLDAVAVEPLARRLKVTKGSFYWHFANRDALVAAALRRWEARDTEQIIAALKDIPRPRTRLERLFVEVMRVRRRSLYHALSASPHPLVPAVLARVTARRIGFVSECYRELGLAPARARHRAVLAYAAYLGLLQIGLDAPAELPPDGRAYLRHLIGTLIPAPRDLPSSP